MYRNKMSYALFTLLLSAFLLFSAQALSRTTEDRPERPLVERNDPSLKEQTNPLNLRIRDVFEITNAVRASINVPLVQRHDKLDLIVARMSAGKKPPSSDVVARTLESEGFDGHYFAATTFFASDMREVGLTLPQVIAQKENFLNVLFHPNMQYLAVVTYGDKITVFIAKDKEEPKNKDMQEL